MPYAWFLPVLVLSSSLMASPVLPGFAGDPHSVEVQSALTSFIEAFDNLDWERFRLAFADDATVFYPRKYPRRASGRVEYEQVFQEIRDGKTAPPFMHIQPKEIEIQRFGSTAIATFHLDDRSGFLDRRSIVLHRFPRGWKIVHLHASEVPVQESARTPEQHK